MTARYPKGDRGAVVFQSQHEDWSKIAVIPNGSEPGDEHGVFISVLPTESEDYDIFSGAGVRLDREDVKQFAAIILEAAGVAVPEELR